MTIIFKPQLSSQSSLYKHTLDKTGRQTIRFGKSEESSGEKANEETVEAKKKRAEKDRRRGIIAASTAGTAALVNLMAGFIPLAIGLGVASAARFTTLHLRSRYAQGANTATEQGQLTEKELLQQISEEP